MSLQPKTRAFLRNLGIVLALGASYLALERWNPQEPTAPSAPAPDFRLPLVTGAGTEPGAAEGSFLDGGTFRGRAVILNFWASWCTACAAERDLLVRLGQEPALAGRIYGIASMDQEEDVREAEGRTPHGYPVALDADGAVAQAFGVASLPHTLVIDAQGHIRHRVARRLEPRDLEMLRGLLGP